MQSSTRNVSTYLINKSFLFPFENSIITLMLLYNRRTPSVETLSQDGVETITPTPGPNDNNNNNKITSFVTTTTTVTLYVAGFSTVVTTTNSQGELITYST